MSQRRAREERKTAGGYVKHQKVPTALLDRSYIQAPVGYDPLTREPIYRSGTQVRRFLEYYGVDTEALAAELEALNDAAKREALEE
jgi:glutamate formiminotransferase